MLRLLWLCLLLVGCLAEEVPKEQASSLDFTGADEAIAVSGSSIQVSWTISSSSQVSGYRVYFVDKSLSTTPIGVASSFSSSYEVTGLEPETQYFFVVRALTSAGELDENLKLVSAVTLEADPLSIEPNTASVGTSSVLQLTGKGGKPPYSFSLLSGSGIVDPASGEFVAPSSSGLSTIRLSDSEGTVVIANISIVNQVSIFPKFRQLAKGRSTVITANSGTPPYSFSVISGSSLANFDSSTNSLSAGSTTGVVTIRVTDANGMTDDSSISIVDEYFPKWALAPGSSVCFALSGLSGTAKCWGGGIHGKLGHALAPGSSPNSMGDNLPELNFGSSNVLDIVVTPADAGSPCALLDSGNVKCWGATWSTHVVYGAPSGESPVGDAAGDLNSQTAITFGSGLKAVKIDGGEQFVCALLDNNQMKCWGRASNGQLLNGSYTNYYDQPNEMGDNLPQLNFGTGRSVKDFSVNSNFGCAILDNDRLKCWGESSHGRLGSGSAANDLGDSIGETGDGLPYVDLGTGRTVKKVDLGMNHACAILDNDQVKCWGAGSNGRTGLETSATIGDAPGEMGDALAYVNLGSGRTAKDLVAGATHTCVILDNDKLKCFGANDEGQIGAQAGGNFGDAPGEMGDNLPYVDLGIGRTAKELFDGKTYSTCVLLDNFETKCFGNNYDGQLGIETNADVGREVGQMGDNLKSIDFGTGRRALKMSSADAVSCAVLDNGKAKCWGTIGHGLNGQDNQNSIGDNLDEVSSDLPDTVLSTTDTIQKIEVSNYTSCALMSSGNMKCWGRDGYGILNGTGVNRAGSRFGSMGDSLAYIKLGTGVTITDFQLEESDSFACALTSLGKLKCWGHGVLGKLGSEATADIGDPGANGTNIPDVNLGSGRTVKAFAKGSAHTCAILDNDKVKCFGYNSYAALGLEDSADRGDNPGEMGDNLPSLNLGTGVVPVAITAGEHFTCILTNDNRVKCWGYNSVGQLGLGHTSTIGDNPGEMGDNLPFVDLGTSEKILKIASSRHTTCALFESERLKCWGSSANGKTIAGTSSNIGDDPSDMGSNLNFVNLAERRVKNFWAGNQNVCLRLENDDLTCFGQGNSGQHRLGSIQSLGDSSNEIGLGINIIKKD